MIPKKSSSGRRSIYHIGSLKELIMFLGKRTDCIAFTRLPEQVLNTLLIILRIKKVSKS